MFAGGSAKKRQLFATMPRVEMYLCTHMVHIYVGVYVLEGLSNIYIYIHIMAVAQKKWDSIFAGPWKQYGWLVLVLVGPPKMASALRWSNALTPPKKGTLNGRCGRVDERVTLRSSTW